MRAQLETSPETVKKALNVFRRLECGESLGLALIVAYSEKTRVIGSRNALPWHKPEDLKFFKEKTSQHPVIMGRLSFQSLKRPLPNRANLVLSRHAFDPGFPEVRVLKTLESAIEVARGIGRQPPFIIGGGQIYAQALQSGLVTHMYLTEVMESIDGDTFFPEFPQEQWVIAEERVNERGDLRFRSLVHVRELASA